MRSLTVASGDHSTGDRIYLEKWILQICGGESSQNLIRNGPMRNYFENLHSLQLIDPWGIQVQMPNRDQNVD